MASLPPSVDVVVIGFGFAGGAAAIAAADAGARVLVVEKAPHPGGISVCSAGGLRVAEDAGPGLRLSDRDLRRQDAGAGAAPPRRGDGGVARPRSRRWRQLMARRSRAAGPAATTRFPGRTRSDSSRSRTCRDSTLPTSRTSAARRPACASSSSSPMRWQPAAMRSRWSRAGRRRGWSADAAGSTPWCSTADSGSPPAPASCWRAAASRPTADLQAQYWPGGPALNAAYRHNTGDGIRMAQAVGADLWHMWHYHGAYGFPPPDPAYPYGVRVKRLPDWRPGDAGDGPGDVVDPDRPPRPALHERIRALSAGHRLAALRRLRSGRGRTTPTAPPSSSPMRPGSRSIRSANPRATIPTPTTTGARTTAGRSSAA